MNPNEDLILGFAHLLKPNKKFKINPENFPSKIGGFPIWVIPEKTPSPFCDQCKNPLKFLFQAFSLNFSLLFNKLT